MTDLPPELEGFAEFLDAQPSNVRDVFFYCLCLMMVETGKMELVDTIAGDESPLCLFRTNTGEEFSVPKPDISPEGEVVLVDALRSILEEEGLLDEE